MAKYLSIDIGGTFIKYAFMDEKQQLYDHHKVKTEENINGAIMTQVEQIIESAMNHCQIKGVGISTAGIVNREKGEIIYAGPTIKNYIGTKFKQHLSQKYDLPIAVENDVNAALLGEIWKGAASNLNNVFCITLGTGIGGAFYKDGLMDGFYHQANSVGYLLYDANSDSNYEMRASTSALTKLIQEKWDETMSTEELFHHAKSGDHLCISIIDSWSCEVAKGLAQIILLLDPKCILIGGGISNQGGYLLHFITKHLPTYLPNQFLKTEIKIASLFNDAALYGAVYPLVREETEHAKRS